VVYIEKKIDYPFVVMPLKLRTHFYRIYTITTESISNYFFPGPNGVCKGLYIVFDLAISKIWQIYEYVIKCRWETLDRKRVKHCLQGKSNSPPTMWRKIILHVMKIQRNKSVGTETSVD